MTTSACLYNVSSGRLGTAFLFVIRQKEVSLGSVCLTCVLMPYLGLFCANGETKVGAGVREQISTVLHAIFSVDVISAEFACDECSASLGSLCFFSVKERANVPSSKCKWCNLRFSFSLFVSTAYVGSPPVAVNWLE